MGILYLLTGALQNAEADFSGKVTRVLSPLYTDWV